MPEEKYYLEKHGYWNFAQYREIDLSEVGYKPDENGYYSHLAYRARQLGWRNLVPIAPDTKGCFIPKWNRWAEVEPADEEIRGWIKGSPKDGLGPYIGFGFAHNGSLVVIDLDCEDADDVRRRLDFLARTIPGTPMIREGRAPGCQIYYRAGPASYGRQCGPEIFHKNKQTVLFGRHPVTGRPFKWKGGSPATRKLNSLPTICGAHLDAFLMRFGHDRMPGRQGGIIMNILKQRGQSLDLMSLDEMAAWLASTKKSMRHPTCIALICHAFYNGNSLEDIATALKPVFCGLYEPSDRRNAAKEFAEMMRYPETNTPQAIGGVHIRPKPAPEFEE